MMVGFNDAQEAKHLRHVKIRGTNVQIQMDYVFRQWYWARTMKFQI